MESAPPVPAAAWPLVPEVSKCKARFLCRGALQNSCYAAAAVRRLIEELSLPDAASSVSSLISVNTTVMTVGMRSHVLKQHMRPPWKCCIGNEKDWLPWAICTAVREAAWKERPGGCVVSTPVESWILLTS